MFLVGAASLLASPCVAVSAGDRAIKAYAFENSQWFDGTGFRPGTFYSSNGVFTFDRPPAVDETIDLTGRYVVPPFAEAHNHNIEPRPDLAKVIRKYLADGVFYVKNPNNPPRAKTALAGYVNTHDSVDVVFANGGLTASGGHPIPLAQRNLERSGRAEDWAEGRFYFVVDRARDLEQKWPQVLATKPDFIKAYLQYSEEYEKRHQNPQYTDRSALDPGILPLIVKRAHAAGLRVSCHIETATDFHNALVADVDEINHMPYPTSDDEDWTDVPMERYRIKKADAALAARSGTVVVTTLTVAMSRIRKAKADETIRKWRELCAQNLSVLKDAGVALAVGSDRYSDTVVGEAFELDQLQVFNRVELLKMWCDTTARTIFPARKIGALRNGYEASFLILNGNPLIDFDQVRSIERRFKQGDFINL